MWFSFHGIARMGWAAAESSVRVLPDLWAAFDKVNRCILLLFLSGMGITGKCTFLVLILPIWVYIQCVMARSSFRPSPALHEGPPRICIHNLTRARHPLLWFITALLCRWHPAVPVFFPLDEPLESRRKSQTVSQTYWSSCSTNRTISSLLFISYVTPFL